MHTRANFYQIQQGQRVDIHTPSWLKFGLGMMFLTLPQTTLLDAYVFPNLLVVSHTTTYC